MVIGFLPSSVPESTASWMRAEIELVVLLGEDIVEAALRQTPMERHLAAFEALDGDAGASLLALDALPEVLPSPEPMPRPSRFFALVAPGLSLSSFSRMKFVP